MSRLWVLVYEINEYNQEGSYFVAAWPKRPGSMDLTATIREANLGVDITQMGFIDLLTHLLKNGGGRINDEDQWFTLHEVEPGQPL